jgi:hypothetical protein
LLKQIQKEVVFYEILGSEQGHVVGFWLVHVAVMIVVHVHSLQIFGGNHLLVQKFSDYFVHQIVQEIDHWFLQLDVDDCHFLCFSVFVEPCEVVQRFKIDGQFAE